MDRDLRSVYVISKHMCMPNYQQQKIMYMVVPNVVPHLPDCFTLKRKLI